MLTGLVYAAVIVLWAVVLVPQWLRRHERNSEHRTTLTFHRAMRTLERRRAARGVSRAKHDVDVVVSGARTRVHDRVAVDETGTNAIDQHLDLGVDPFVGSVDEQEVIDARRVRSQIRARETASRRRRQVQQVLVALSLISVVLLVMGIMPLMMALLSPLALGVFWYVSRRQAEVARLATARRARRDEVANATAGQQAEGRQRRTTRGSTSRSTAGRKSQSDSRDRRRSARRHVDRSAAAGHGTGGADLDESTDVRVLSTAEVSERRASVAANGSWEPVEAPLPTYVDSKRATPMPRNIDSSARGDWTSERMMEQVDALRVPDIDAEAELGLDAFVDVPASAADDDAHYSHRRAVND
ncbi:MAG: hypothetical protein ACOYD0_11635 [Candidatus Nanopelagicales bacterium]